MKKLLTFLIILFSITSNVVWSADYNKGWDAYNRGDYATALLEWRPLAEQGDEDAQYNLGIMYYNGRGVPQNYKSAVKWYKLAANQGSNDAQWNLGVMYSDGTGVEKNYILGYMYAVVSGSNADGEWAKSNMTQDELSTAKKLVKDCKSANNRCETVVNNLVKEEDAKEEELKKKAAERKRVAEENKKIALLPTQTEFQNAQHFLSDIQKYLVSNKDEFDFFEIVKFTKNTKLISEGILDDEQFKNVELFKAFVESSDAFLKFQKNSQDNRKISNLAKIDESIGNLNYQFRQIKSFSNIHHLTLTTKDSLYEKIKSSQQIINNPKSIAELDNTTEDLRLFLSDLRREVEKTISTRDENKKISKEFNAELLKIDENISNLKTYYLENTDSISDDLTDLILEKVALLQSTKEGISLDNKKEALVKLLKVNTKISIIKLENDLFTSDEVAAIKKAEEDKKKVDAKKIADKKKAEERKRKADAKRKADSKEAKRLKNFRKVKMTCIFDRLYSLGGVFKDDAEQKWTYDGKKIYLNGSLLRVGSKVDWNYGKVKINKLTKQDSFKSFVYYSGNLAYTVEVDFDNKEAFMKYGNWTDDGLCYPY